MDIDLIEASIKYHGKELYDLLARENDLEPAKDSLVYADERKDDAKKELAYETNSDLAQNSEDDGRLYKRLLKFIVNKSDYLFNERIDSPLITKNGSSSSLALSSKACANDEDADKYEIEFDLAPIETFMEVPLRARKEHLLKYIEPDDIVIGCIDQVIEAGIYMNIVCFDNHKRRDLSRVDLNLFCPYSDAVRSAQAIKNNIKQLHLVYFKNDLVRSKVVIVDKDKEFCQVSLIDDNLKLGTIAPEEIPSYQQNIEFYREEPYTFSKDLKRERAFNNPACVNMLLKKLNLRPTWSSNFSLMPTLNKVKIPREEMADYLLKSQNKILALQNVEKGVKYFKEDRSNDAMVCFKKAISIDEENVEAYVARGALYANEGDLDKAIDDFEKALKLDSDHSNAKKYLKEVFLNYSIKMEKREDYDEAISYLKKGLSIDPDNELIKNKIKSLNKKIDEIYKKNMYGPSLPSETTSKRTRRDSSSSSSSSSDTDSSIQSIKEESKSSDSNRERSQSSHSYQAKVGQAYSRSISSSSAISQRSKTSVNNPPLQPPSLKKQEPKRSKNDAEDDDDEDLEEFYLKLKQNKANAKK